MAKILIIDDDSHICETLVLRFTRLNHEVVSALTLRHGLDLLFANAFDIVFLDINLPDGNGLEAIGTIKEHAYPPEIIIMTGDTDLEGAELAMKSKAWDYIDKSCSLKEFKFSLIRAIEYREQKQLRSSEIRLKRESIIGQSSQIKACIKRVAKATNSDAPVLLLGETGTGKELISRAIHENSHRNENGFVVVDCAALPEHLVESVLFGHVKGAFTGADTDKVGLMRLADGGTLFLDEVGELPAEIQKKFLRAVQEMRFRPLGSDKEVVSNFRLIAATHRDVVSMIRKKRFRQDLYYRISSIKIEVPPLRNRNSDIPLLVAYHMERKQARFGKFSHDLSDEFMEQLQGYDWPGNVRELFNTIEYACSDAFQETMLFPKHLPDYIRVFSIKKKILPPISSKPEKGGANAMAPVESLGLKAFTESMKLKYMQDLMIHVKGDIKLACKLSNLSRGHLYSLLKKYNINNP